MSVSYISDTVKFRLWAKSAGRCQYEGCNDCLWLDQTTKAEFNTAYIAHIIADRPDGPRGDKVLSEKLKSDISNLMLMCDKHHRLIDIADVAGHSVERLQEMKKSHEERMERLTSISANLQSEVVIYCANVGEQKALVHWQDAANAMVPFKFPARNRATEIGLNGSTMQDHESSFWELEQTHLRREFDRHINLLRENEELPHMSVFSVAPQPLLIELGHLLGEIADIDVYQLHREPRAWSWLEGDSFEYYIHEPEEDFNTVALNISLSGLISEERIRKAIGDDVSIWSIEAEEIGNDTMRTREQLSKFRATIRDVVNRIKSRHTGIEAIHLFPAAPISAAVEVGRTRMPKADPKYVVWDQSNKAGGFIQTLTMGGNQ